MAFVSTFTFCEEIYALPLDDAASTTLRSIDKEVTPSKDLKEVIKAGKEARKNKKNCARDCGYNYDPLCAHDPSDPTFKPRTFGSQCVLEVYNCEMGAKLAMKSKGECPGAGGTRLS